MGRVLVWHTSSEELKRVVESPAINKAIKASHTFCSDHMKEVDYFRPSKRSVPVEPRVVKPFPSKQGMRKEVQVFDMWAFEDCRKTVTCWKDYRKHQCHHYIAPNFE